MLTEHGHTFGIPIRTKLTFRGLKELLLPVRSRLRCDDIEAERTRALFQLPDGALTERRRSLVEFLAQVSLFEDLPRRDLARLTSIVHEREYGDGEYICEEGHPGAALFVVRRGLAEVVRRGAGGQALAVALLEPRAADALVDTYGGRAESPRPHILGACPTAGPRRTSNKQAVGGDRKSTRLNSSH